MSEAKEFTKTIMCEVCGKHEATVRDYRFIDQLGFQGKVLACQWCYGLNDVSLYEIVRDKLDPKDLYDEEE